MGIGISVEGLTQSFGSQRIWEDVTMEVPEREVSVLLGPSGTGKSVFLKSSAIVCSACRAEPFDILPTAAGWHCRN